MIRPAQLPNPVWCPLECDTSSVRGPHHNQRISAPPPLPCTHLSMQHIIMTARLIYVELSLIQTLRWFFYYFIFCTADCVDMGSHVVCAHLCSLVFTRSSMACVHVCCVMRTGYTCMQKAGSNIIVIYIVTCAFDCFQLIVVVVVLYAAVCLNQDTLCDKNFNLCASIAVK